VRTPAAVIHGAPVSVSVKLIEVAESWNPSVLLRLRLNLPKLETLPGTFASKLAPNPLIAFDSVTAPRLYDPLTFRSAAPWPPSRYRYPPFVSEVKLTLAVVVLVRSMWTFAKGPENPLKPVFGTPMAMSVESRMTACANGMPVAKIPSAAATIAAFYFSLGIQQSLS
jgi:hypothetical protein